MTLSTAGWPGRDPGSKETGSKPSLYPWPVEVPILELKGKNNSSRAGVDAHGYLREPGGEKARKPSLGGRAPLR